MKIYIEKANKHSALSRAPKDFTVAALLKKLKINPQNVIVVRESEVILEDEELSESDEIKILSVISGG